MKGEKRKPAYSPELFGRSSRTKTIQETEEITTLQPITMEQETSHLTNNYNYFPELVWKLVLKKLRTSSDIENCSNSGYFFNKLLRKKREINIVLPKVFEILAEKYAKSEDDSYIETNPQCIPWNRSAIRQISLMTGIWKCRLVNKSWSKAIDDLFQQYDVGHSSFTNIDRPMACTLAYKNSHLLQYTKYHLTLQTAEDFITHFNSTHYDMNTERATKNPFNGRNAEFLILTPGSQDFMVQYRNDICEIFEKWGREIWYCGIFHFPFTNEYDEVKFYQVFRESLIRMPNLKSLNVYCNVKRNNYVQPQPELLSEIREKPLPTLQKLTSFKVYNLRGPIFDHFVSLNILPEVNISARN